jgi:hypothetical protein
MSKSKSERGTGGNCEACWSHVTSLSFTSMIFGVLVAN